MYNCGIEVKYPLISGEAAAPQDVPEELQERLLEPPERGQRRHDHHHDGRVQQRRERRRQTHQREGKGTEYFQNVNFIHRSTESCEKIHACLNLPSLFLPTDLGSQCTAHQP